MALKAHKLLKERAKAIRLHECILKTQKRDPKIAERLRFVLQDGKLRKNGEEELARKPSA